MGTINLKIAELRKNMGLTQQELGDILSVSFQTISKWENGVTLPDITVLPMLSEFFQVSVDALLGLVPLGDEYHPTNSDQSEYWKKRISYIKQKRKGFWNTDYLQFLIDKVWCIDKPVRVLDMSKLWKREYLMQNRDYSIAMKVPHFMRKLGLKNIDVRMNDRVTFLAPEQPDYQQAMQNIMNADQWQIEKSTEETEEQIQYFMNHGMTRKNAEDYFRKQNTIVRYLREHEGEVSLTRFIGVMISYGWK